MTFLKELCHELRMCSVLGCSADFLNFPPYWIQQTWSIFSTSFEDLKRNSMSVFRRFSKPWRRAILARLVIAQARNQDFIWGGANEAKVDQTTEMYFILSDPFI